MTRLLNAPSDFPAQLLEGFAAAYPDFVTAVPGGVVRSTAHDDVAVVVGGGTGHYPAFCGLVGEGLAHGAAMGNIFSSPSAQQAYSVARAAERGQGVVFSFGNYAGDVMHFGEAAARLRNDGIKAECVVVTDDIASAPADEMEKRRGIAGDLTVFKVLGAAAGEGYAFDEVVRVGRHANERTRSFGVAFDGCTLPGADQPLFTVPEGMMSLGLGIHGEPGIADRPMPTAEELAHVLVERLLSERPDGSDARVAVLLNGLGTVKYEELFVVFRTVSTLLAEAGLTIVSPDVGELCTSLDMAGVSLTLFWLDDELERLWTSPSSTPAYRKGAATTSRALSSEERAALTEWNDPASTTAVEGSAASRAAAATAVEALTRLAALFVEASPELGRIDAVAGDGDHGVGMERGAVAARDAARGAADAGAGVGSVLRAAGTAWADVAGGTSGALWGAGLQAMGDRLGDRDAVDARRLTEAVIDARQALSVRGGANVGDKTMMDVLIPYAERLEELLASGSLTRLSWLDAAEEAHIAAAETRDLTPRLGRARPLAEKSVGTPDAGATSLAMAIGTLTEYCTTKEMS